MINENLKDSLIRRLEEKNNIQAETILEHAKIQDNQEQIIILKNEKIAYYDAEVKRQKRKTIFTGIISGFVGVVLGFLVSLL